jgi:hypothetical protein
MKLEGSLLPFHATAPYPDPDEFGLHPQTMFLPDKF